MSSRIGSNIDETGTLLRDNGGFWLRRDIGGRYRLEMQRIPVKEISRRVRLRGVMVADDLVSANSVIPA